MMIVVVVVLMMVVTGPEIGDVIMRIGIAFHMGDFGQELA